MALALADKLDTLAGIFAIGQKPTGTRIRSACAARRSGVLRILIERKLDLDLRALIERSRCAAAAVSQRSPTPARDEV